MAYIGKSPVIGNFVKLDAITAVNGQAAYTMQNGGSNFTDYESVNQFLVSLNGTIQAPTDSFTVSGSTLTFASNLATGDVIDFVMVFGNSLSAGTPTDATVSTAKIVDDAVTAAKINNDIISGSTELASEPADTDEFLVSDAGTLKRIDYSLIKAVGGLSEVDIWRLTAESSSAAAYLTANLERDDSTGATYIGTGMSESSGVFTYPSTGKYLIYANGTFYCDTGPEYYASMQIHVTTNNSDYGARSYSQTSSMNSTGTTAYMNSNAIYLFDVTDTSTHKVKFYWNRSGHAKIIGSTNVNQTYFLFQKLGDT